MLYQPVFLLTHLHPGYIDVNSKFKTFEKKKSGMKKQYYEFKNTYYDNFDISIPTLIY